VEPSADATVSPPPPPGSGPAAPGPVPPAPLRPSYDTDRVWTLPNVLSLLRLAGVPLLLWLILGPQADGLAVLVLAAAGFTDWLDGYLARRLNQRSRLGQMLDPVADRFYILATLLGLAIRDIIPWWLVAILVARDLVISLLVPILKTRGYSSLPVHFLGKAATFNLLYAFPLVLLGDGDGTLALVARVVGWAFAWWGTGLYWWAGGLYLVQTYRLLRSTPRVDRRLAVTAPPP
jgi:cardiolipin synthase